MKRVVAAIVVIVLLLNVRDTSPDGKVIIADCDTMGDAPTATIWTNGAKVKLTSEKANNRSLCSFIGRLNATR